MNSWIILDNILRNVLFYFVIANFIQVVVSSTDDVEESNSQKGNVDISSNLERHFLPCRTTTSCPTEFPQCLQHLNGTTECVNDICWSMTCRMGEICIPRIVSPCVELWEEFLEMTSTTTVNETENGLPLQSHRRQQQQRQRRRRLCAYTPQCIPNACRDNLLCSSQSVCELDMNGRPLCRPIVPSISLSTIQDGDGVVTLSQRLPTCEEIICVAGSVCQLNTTTGISMCQKSNLCTASSKMTTTTNRTAPCPQNDKSICIAVVPSTTNQTIGSSSSSSNSTTNTTTTTTTTTTTIQCVPDPCRNKNTTVCVDGSCRVDSKGQPLCLPIPDDLTTNNPPWWTYIQTHFRGSKLSLCSQRKEKIPSEGDDCLSLGKTCFFGQQDCASAGPFPTIRCDCVRKKWTCDTTLDCPISFDTMFS